MTRSRWWETGGRTIEGEAAAFKAASLAFELDEELFKRSQAVVFRGELRLDGRRVPAEVRYPSGYGDDEPVAVFAPTLPIGRHRTPQGALCLDHAVFGEAKPMAGVEAVQRAERLWWLWENDRAQLHEEEAPAPDPRANYYAFEQDSAIALVDVDVDGLHEGEMRLDVSSVTPFRAGVGLVRATRPRRDVPLNLQHSLLRGSVSIGCFWRRLPEPLEIFDADRVLVWAKTNAADLLAKATGLAEVERQHGPIKNAPAIIAFVYPDEGPGRGETHDAWLFLLVRPDGFPALARPAVLRGDERWNRQPQLQPLEMRTVAVVGTGALGSPIAAHLARAGVGKLVLVDPDIVSVGNRVRHELDLRDVGRSKVDALADRLHNLNPWMAIARATLRFGAATNHPDPAQAQKLDDQVWELLSNSDLIVNASAHAATGFYCSRLGREAHVPVVHAWVSAGAWGGRVLVQAEGSGCYLCLGHAQTAPAPGAERVPEWSDDPNVVQVFDRGCADPTFTGPGFELADAAAAAARIAVQELLAGNGYPERDFDLVTLTFRDATVAQPDAVYRRFPPHPDCEICSHA